MRLDQEIAAIDQICLKFEDALRSGRRESIEERLAEVPDESRVHLLRELLLLELDYTDEPPDIDSMVARFPEFEATIRECQDATQSLTPQRLEAGERVGRYVVHKLLGEGAFGSVYTAWDEELQRRVALKSPRLIGQATSATAKRFQLEAIALAKLRHANIMAIHDVVADQNGWPLLVLEYVEAEALDVTCGLQMLVESLAHVARAMDYVHQQGIVHRDLKPQNILVEPSGRVVVADFGLSLHTEVQQEQQGELAGTIRYMSPELIRGESHWADGRADVWSLGVMLYEALAGTVPFPGDDYETVAEAILHRPARPPRQLNPACPRELEEICLKCLRRSPEDRYATAGDLAKALETFQRGPGRHGLLRKVCAALLAVVCGGLLLAAAVASNLWGDNPPSALVEGGTPTVAPLPAREVTATSNVTFADVDRVAVQIHFNVARQQPAGASHLRLESAVPLRDGDAPEIFIQTGSPCRLWIFWIDSNAKVTPIFPWSNRDWQALPELHDAVTELDLAPNWALHDFRSGSETLVVLGVASDAKMEVDMRALFDGWQPQTKQFADVIEYDFGLPIEATRRSEVRDEPKYEIPLYENQRLFREPRFRQFSICRSICIPVRGATE